MLAALSVGCDSRQRGENQSSATEDKPPVEELSVIDDHGLTPDEPESADEPPEASALDRYTEDLEGEGALMVSIKTTHGIIECELFADQTPVTVANFVGLARGMKAFRETSSNDAVTGVRYYDGLVFHRVIPGFLIQSGDRDGHGHGDPGYRIPDEFSEALRHDREGVMSMANRGPGTGGSQFFILEAAAPHLDDRHTVFGHCDSPRVIRAISHVPTEDMGRPVDPAPKIEAMKFYRAQ